MIDGTALVLLALLAGLAGLAWWRGGSELAVGGLREGGGLIVRYGPVIVISLLAAGFADQLLPRESVRDWLGPDAGLGGIVFGAAAGIITPSGPFVSMPLAAVMLRSGAGAGAVVAFLSAWSLLAIHRLVAWEVPILGWRFALVRYGTCLVLPILAGLAARALVREGVSVP
jgi:uncharacterized membrane protein YraQ (UPF0718 family)